MENLCRIGKESERQVLVSLRIDSQKILDRLDQAEQYLAGALISRAMDEMQNAIALIDSSYERKYIKFPLIH